MKKLVLLFIIICSKVTGQNNLIVNEAFQKDRFDLGKFYLDRNESKIALSLFYYAHKKIPNNELGRIALKKYDSLIPIVREKHKKSIIGNWKKIQEGATWVIPENDLVGEMIKITSEEIQFYELYKKAKEWCLIKTEPIVYCKKAEEVNDILDVSFTEFTFKNKEVWQYYIDEKTGLLNVFLYGDESKEGLSQIICGGISHKYFKLE